MLAERLTEDGRHRVLLLEAGGSDRRLRVQLPIGYGKSFYDPRVNWMYRTEPEPALAGRRGYWPRGKVLGGSSSINAMVYVRGQAADFDDWEARGNPGWGWNDVLPYFRRIEGHAHGPMRMRGAGGPLHVSDVSRDVHPLCATLSARRRGARACRATPDFNGASAGRRRPLPDHDARRPARCRRRAPICGRRCGGRTCACETQCAGHAHPVRRHARGRRRLPPAAAPADRVRARPRSHPRAGAINSPQLLQLSGVGPGRAAAVAGHRGACATSPAVGRNLQDHLCIDHLYRSRVPTLNDELRPWRGRLRAALRYLRARGAARSRISVNQGGGFVRSRPGLARRTCSSISRR